MRIVRRLGLPAPSLSFALLAALLVCLWIAGGASRADVAGQAIVRGVATGALVLAFLLGGRPAIARAKPVAVLLALTLALPLAQLVPLPPMVWNALPGRAMLDGIGLAVGQGEPWRPSSIVPGATANAVAALIVPVAVLILLAGLREERAWLPGLLLGLVTASMLVGLLQVSGAGFDNPLVNDNPGVASGLFANRNHFALFLALGCLLASGWVFARARPGWRGPVGLGLVLLFTLTILASGSRAGTGLGVVALAIALGLSWRGLRTALRQRPRWVLPTCIAVMASLIAALVAISVEADRAISINRVLAEDASEDMRGRALPAVLAMIRDYFPVGSGVGSFDPVFRLHEPFALLKPTYFNHAHNDFLEIVLDAGLPGLLLLVAALTWWGWASVRAWRAAPGPGGMLPRLGSAMLLLVFVASLFDYPARTPLIMAMVVIAAVWLCDRPDDGHGASALPRRDQHL